MARKRSGSLVSKPTGYFARVWMPITDDAGDIVLDDDGNARMERRFISLETKDIGQAKRKLAALVAGIESGRYRALAEVKDNAARSETFKEYADAWVEPRKTSKVMGRSEATWLSEYVYPTIGHLPPRDVKRTHVKQILAAATNQGLARETVRKIRAVTHRVFVAALEDEIVIANPVAAVKVPSEAKVDKRPRTLPTDDEMVRLFQCTHRRVSLHIKLVALVARELGGARTCEVNRLDWLSVDRLHFTACVLPRGKDGAPQTLDLPPDVAENLRAWWEKKGRPERGPVFPVERGRRKGQARMTVGVSYAKRLRRAFTYAGVTRHELHNDTPVSRRCDFHSLRRSYVTSLAAANVNEQRAMRLTGHTSSATHRRYTMDTPEMRAIPITALPPQGVRVLALAGANSPRSKATHAERESHAATGTDDATPRNDDENAGFHGLRRPTLYPAELMARARLIARRRARGKNKRIARRKQREMRSRDRETCALSTPSTSTDRKLARSDSGTDGAFSLTASAETRAALPLRIARLTQIVAAMPDVARSIVAFAAQ